MTVKELIKKLKDFDENLRVFVEDSSDMTRNPISRIEIAEKYLAQNIKVIVII